MIPQSLRFSSFILKNWERTMQLLEYQYTTFLKMFMYTFFTLQFLPMNATCEHNECGLCTGHDPDVSHVFFKTHGGAYKRQ